MKRWLSLATVVVLCLALVIGIACGGGEEEEAGVKKLKFGIGLPMTGSAGAVCGLPTKWASELAVEKIGEFEVAGERYVWDPVFEDNLLSTAGGVASTNKFIYEYHVDFVFQAGADSALAAAMITEPLGKFFDMAAASPWDIRSDWHYTFQTGATWAEGAGTFFDWLTTEHPEVRRIGASAAQTFVGQAMFDCVKYACEYYGLELEALMSPGEQVEVYPTATRLMSFEPDLVFGGYGLFEAMCEMGYEGYLVSDHWTEAAGGAIDWDYASGRVFAYMPHPFGEMWPEVVAFAAEFEDDYGVELTPSAFWMVNIWYILTEVLKQAGTVDDVEKIIQTMESGVSFDSLVGPVYYGCEAVNGIGHVGVWPSPIYKVIGQGQYEVMKVYTPEETEAITNAIYAERD